MSEHTFGEFPGFRRTSDVSSPPKPHDPPWRSRTAHRSLDPEVASMLADARARLGWPVAVAARQVGISDRMLRYLERGERVPSTAVAEDIISGLGLDEIDADLLRSVALPDVGRASPFRGGDARLLRYAGAAGPGGES